jgi:hypothetical protein
MVEGFSQYRPVGRLMRGAFAAALDQAPDRHQLMRDN